MGIPSIARPTRVLTWLGLTSVLLLQSLGASAQGFAVVASADRADERVTAAIVRRLYLKEQADWPSGIPGKPLGRPSESPAQREFLRHVLRMDQPRLTRHWIALKQRTGQRRVIQVDSDRKLVLMLRRFPEAFGVLPLSVAESDPSLVVLLKLP